MGRPREKEKKKPKTPLQELFIRRVLEEKGELSATAIAGRKGGPKQRTLNDILNGADPRLEAVYRIATALNIPAWQLFLEKADVVRLLTPRSDNVSKLPEPPRILDRGHLHSRDKKRRTA